MNQLISVYVQEVYKTTIIRQILAIQDVIRADPKFALVKGPAGAQYCPIMKLSQGGCYLLNFSKTTT